MAQKTSGTAIASMVLGICSIIFGWIPVFGWAIILTGLILGILSLLAIRKNKDLSGKGYAITGVILSAISLIIVVLLIVGMFTLFTDIKKNWANKESLSGDIAYDMNQDFNLDSLTYRITKAETFTEMGTDAMKKTTNEKFIKVYFQITNNANETQQIYSKRLRLIDEQNRKFDSFSGESSYIGGTLQIGVQIQPTFSVSGATVFEIPKGAKDLKLEIRGGMLSASKATVNLSYIQDIGKDVTLQNMKDNAINESGNTLPEDMTSGETMVTTTKKELTTCDEPLKCISTCEGINLGQMNCPSGRICCWIN